MNYQRFTCPRGHKIAAPYKLDVCPLAFWGPLKSKKETQEHYAAQADRADA